MLMVAFQVLVNGTMIFWALREYTSPVSKGCARLAAGKQPASNKVKNRLFKHMCMFNLSVLHENLSRGKLGYAGFMGHHNYGLSLEV